MAPKRGTNLRYLDLSGGEYEADSELRIPDLFVLRLGRYDDITGINISSTPDPNPYLTSEPSLVSFQNVRYSAIVGGYIDAGGNETWEAINVYESSFCVISGVRAFADGENVINIQKGTGHLVSDSFVDGRNKAGRCLWLLATSNAMVFGNRIVRCYGHSLDVDAYVSRTFVGFNELHYNGYQGIFLEETANRNFLFRNNISHSTYSAIDVYALVVGPVRDNVIARNFVADSRKGITSGGHRPSGHWSENNIFVANEARGEFSYGAYEVKHFDTNGDIWIRNTFDGETDQWVGGDPERWRKTTVFEYELIPTGRTKIEDVKTSSALQIFIEANFPQVSKDSYKDASFFNEDNLRHLLISNSKIEADETLVLPSMFVLQLINTSFVPTSATNYPVFSLNNSTLTSVIGGEVNAPGGTAFSVSNSTSCSIAKVAVVSPLAVDIVGGRGIELRDGNLTGIVRVKSSSNAILYDNLISEGGIDVVDAEGCAIFDNSVVGGNVGIAVRETSNHNFVFSNNISGSEVGIKVHSETRGPVQRNLVGFNTLEQCGTGLEVGGVYWSVTRSEKNIFMRNTAKCRDGAFDYKHNHVWNDYWIGNLAGAGPHLLPNSESYSIANNESYCIANGKPHLLPNSESYSIANNESYCIAHCKSYSIAHC
ncbi:hypothetical protein TrRE_jg8632 [Triparma retinervis]|uniref:Right handed beta helix domain-containing protein n=1 Tax=Triparma retinervis TaxID=2557542 RepID=A0A9W7C7I8_9STRA|nr:hypothetical protein TrRE_jg8632 [Triparma retinervis]